MSYQFIKKKWYTLEPIIICVPYSIFLDFHLKSISVTVKTKNILISKIYSKNYKKSHDFKKNMLEDHM